jgi:hypothetical protein
MTGRLTGRRAAAGVLAALLLLTIAWLAGGHSRAHPPVYDGVNAPDEPYRFIVAPPGAKKAKGPATSATASTGVKQQANAAELFGASDEQGPQIAFYIPAGGISPVSGPTVKVVATPQAPTGRANGPFVGNAYAVAVASSGAAALTPAGVNGASIQLRAPTAKQPGPTIEWHPPDTNTFQPLTTARTGNDIYTSRFAGFGTYVLVQAPVTHSSKGGGFPVVLVVLIVVVVLLIALIVLVRIRRTRSARDAQ